MADHDSLDATIATTVHESFNNEENNTNVGIGVENALNEDNSQTNSNNLGVEVTDSFHEDSYNNEWDIDDSGNTDSYNKYLDASDNSTNDNSDNSTNDNSINAGNRAYNTGFGDLTVGGAAGGAAAAAAAGGGGGSVSNHSTIVDQSVNANIAAFGPVKLHSESESVVASGDDSLAAGDDIDIDTEVDHSTSIYAGDDVNIGNETTTTTIVDSFNTYTDNSTWEDNSVDLDLDNVLNDYSETYTATDSFNDDKLLFSETDVDVDVDAIVHSEGAAILDDLDL